MKPGPRLDQPHNVLFIRHLQRLNDAIRFSIEKIQHLQNTLGVGKKFPPAGEFDFCPP
jgi:hypothetical protein